jgi:hypothetical protein
MMKRVRGVMAASIFAASSMWSAPMSTGTGTPPAKCTEAAAHDCRNEIRVNPLSGRALRTVTD